MMTPEKVPGIRRAGICGVYPAHTGCASSFGIAAYNLKVTRAKNTPHFSGLARLAYDCFKAS